MIAWRGWSNRKGGSGVSVLFSFVSVDSCASTGERKTGSATWDWQEHRAFVCFVSLSLSLSLSFSLSLTLSLSLSLSRSLSLSLETCTSSFSSPSPPFPPRPPSSRTMSYLGRGLLLSSSGATSEADLRATLVGCHEYVSVALTNKNRSEARKGNWNFLTRKNRKTGKGNCPPAQESGVSPSLKTRPQISMVILGIVWFWRHEFLWRHFSRSLCTRFL